MEDIGGSKMLVLQRKLLEKIRIGEDVVIQVICIKKGLVRLGIEAPKNVRVDREEVHQQRKAGGE